MIKYLLALVAAFWMQTAAAELVVIANPDVKVSHLSREQLAHIFLGQTINYPDGRAAVPLDVSGDYRSSFYTYVLKRSPTQVEKYWARMIFTGKAQPPHEVSIKEVKAKVAETSGAISYVDSATVDSTVKVISIGE